MSLGISHRSATMAAAAAVALLALAGCGSSKKSAMGAKVSVATNPTIAAEVPAAIKAKGTLTVAADATYAPNEFIAPDGKTVIGMDPDLVKALATVMGLKVKVVNATFASNPYTFYINYQTNLVSLTAVPEPSTYALLGAGALLIALKRRRRS